MQRQNSSSDASPNVINTGVPKQNIVVNNNTNNNTMASSYIRPRIAEWWWKENIQQHYYIQKLLQNQQQAPPLPDSAVPTFFEVVFDEADEYNKKQNAGIDDDDGYDDDVLNDNDEINTKILHQRFHVPPFPPRVLQSSRQFRVEVGNDQEQGAEAQSPVHENASSSSTATLVEDDEILIDEENLSDHKSDKKQRQEVAHAPDAKNVADRLWEGHKTAMNFAESTPSDAAKSLSPLKESNGTSNKNNQNEKNNLPKRNQSALSLGSIALTNQNEQWVAVTTPAASTAEVLDWASASCVVALNNNNKESSINRKQKQQGQRTAPSPASTFATMTTTNDILSLQQPHQRANMQNIAPSVFNNMISSPPTSTTNENNNRKQSGPLFPRSSSLQLQNTKDRQEEEEEGKESSFGFASYFTSAVARCLILTQELLMEHDRRNVEEEKARILIKVRSYASNNNEELDAMDNFTVISQMKEQQQQQEKNKGSVRDTPAEGDEKTSLAGGSSITKQQQKQTPSAGVDSSPFSVINLHNNHSADAVVGISISATPAILTTIEGEEVEEDEEDEERNNINRNEHEEDQDAGDDEVNSSWSACSQAGDSECEAHAATAVENWLKERQPNSNTNNNNNVIPAQNISSASAAAASLPLNWTARTTVGGIPLSQLKSEVYFRSVKSKNTAGPLGLMRQGISDASLYGDDSSVYSESQFAGNGNGGAQQQLPSPSRNRNSCHRHHRDRNHILQERSPFTNHNNNRTDRQRRSAASASNCSSKSTKTSSSLASPSSPPQPNQKENTNPFCDDDEPDEKEHNQEQQQQNIINNNNNNDHNAKVFSMADQEQRMRINANNNNDTHSNNNNNSNNTEEVMDFISSASTLKSALKFALRSVARSALEEWVGVLPALVLLPHHYAFNNNNYYHEKNQQNQNSVSHNNNNNGNNKSVASSNESYQEQKANRKQDNNNNNSVKSPSNNSSNGGMLSSMLYSNRRNQTPEQEERLRQFMKTFYASQKNAVVKNLVSAE